MLPKGLGFGSGVTCWRRLRDWQTAGVWRRLHRVLLDELGKAGMIRQASHALGQVLADISPWVSDQLFGVSDEMSASSDAGS
jgi:transposase